MRFICPAVLSTLSIGRDLPTNTRRNLTLVTKLLQNVANGIRFGEKEKYLTIFNDFVEVLTGQAHAFMTKLSNPPNMTPSTPDDTLSSDVRCQRLATHAAKLDTDFLSALKHLIRSTMAISGNVSTAEKGRSEKLVEKPKVTASEEGIPDALELAATFFGV